MKNFKDLAVQRRSCHTFEPGFKLSPVQFEQLVTTTAYTPSGYNAQPWSFCLVQSEDKLQELQKICLNQSIVTESGNMVVVLGDKEFGTHEVERILSEWEKYRALSDNKLAGLKSSLLKEREDWKKREMTLRNCSLAAMTFLYAAEDLGLATCPMMGFRQLDLRKWLKLPDHLIPVMMVAVGKKKVRSCEDEKLLDKRLPRKSPDDLIWGVL